MDSDAPGNFPDKLSHKLPSPAPREKKHSPSPSSSPVCIETPPLVATPPLVTTPVRSKLQKRLDTFRAPFESASPFRVAKSESSDCDNTPLVRDIAKQQRKTKNKRASDATAGGEAPAIEKRRNRGSRGAAGAVRALGRLRPSCRGDNAVTPEPASLNTVVDVIANNTSAGVEDIVSHSGSTVATHDMQDSSVDRSPSEAEPRSMALTCEDITSNEDIVQIDKEEGKINTVKGFDPTAVVVDHPVSTLPFAKSSWKRRRSQDLKRPIETPSPESARRRVALVTQETDSVSVDLSDKGEQEGAGRRSDAAGAGASLQRMVELAQLRLTLDRDGDGRGAAGARGSRKEVESDAMSPAPHGDLITANAEPDTTMGAALVSSHATAAGGERREHLYKILVIGELGTGKTSIIKRYVHQFFSQHYRATIGVDFALKVLNWDAQTVIRLQLWDIAGQERFGNMTRVYYKEAVGAFVVFDVTRVATFDAVVKWKMDLDSKVQLPDGSPIPCILLANKCDQQKEGIVNTPSKMDEYCREKGFAGWFETSAKENVNIEEAARSLVNKILLNDKLLQSSESRDSERFSLEQRAADGHDASAAAAGSRSCAC